eukprot:8942858-Pyramimonas_sp.AAC.1
MEAIHSVKLKPIRTRQAQNSQANHDETRDAEGDEYRLLGVLGADEADHDAPRERVQPETDVIRRRLAHHIWSTHEHAHHRHRDRQRHEQQEKDRALLQRVANAHDDPADDS